MKRKLLRWMMVAMALALTSAATGAVARDAAFMEPSASSNSAANDDSMRVEPKADIDVGDSPVNIARHVTLFFINQSNIPVGVEKVSVNNDSNVAAEIVNDDCTKQATMAPTSRCSVEVSITPSSGGSWTVETLMTHSGAGRLTRAKITGKTNGGPSTDKKEMGLSLSAKDIKPIDFGDVDAGAGKAVRSALMVNDSYEPITLYAIDVIEADNGLKRLDQGCSIDMELKPGESCPVTMVWVPQDAGAISTDLIIRHSGKLGFAVIPIRGNAKSNKPAAGKDDVSGSKGSSKGSGISLAPPPSVNDLAAAMAKVPALSSNALTAPAVSTTERQGVLQLIGTVGNRAVLLKPNGTTVVADVGEDLDMGDHKAKLMRVDAKSADVSVDGKVRKLTLGASQDLIDQAMSLKQGKSGKSDSPSQGQDNSKAGFSSTTLPTASSDIGIRR